MSMLVALRVDNDIGYTGRIPRNRNRTGLLTYRATEIEKADCVLVRSGIAVEDSPISVRKAAAVLG